MLGLGLEHVDISLVKHRYSDRLTHLNNNHCGGKRDES